MATALAPHLLARSGPPTGSICSSCSAAESAAAGSVLPTSVAAQHMPAHSNKSLKLSKRSNTWSACGRGTSTVWCHTSWAGCSVHCWLPQCLPNSSRQPQTSAGRPSRASSGASSEASAASGIAAATTTDASTTAVSPVEGLTPAAPAAATAAACMAGTWPAHMARSCTSTSLS